MLPPELENPHEVVRYYDHVYASLIDSGQAYPFLYPWGATGAGIIFAYLLIDHRNRPYLKAFRFPLFIAFAAFELWCILTNRARNPASAFGVGLISSWGTLWTAAIMIANDCQTDFKRIERAVPKDSQKEYVSAPPDQGVANGMAIANGTLRNRKANATDGKDGVSDAPGVKYFWQSFPSTPSLARLDWVSDVFCSFRGVGWNWEVSGVPPPPATIRAALQTPPRSSSLQKEDEEYTISRSGIRRYFSRRVLLRVSTINLIIDYLILDALKTFVHHDPYFWGYTSHTSHPAPAFLPSFIRSSYILTKSYRLLVSLAAIYWALRTIFHLGPAFFCGLLGPNILGVRGEPWTNPADSFGDFNLVLEKGLAGWWGGWWHQTFRFAFEAPATKILQLTGIKKKTLLGRTLALFIAFFLSGCLHAAGSYTQLGDTRPLMGPMRFFLLQAVGITVQNILVQFLRRWKMVRQSPGWVGKVTNFVAVHWWLYLTAPLLVDDFAKGGVWLFEPVPFSPLRGLGFGASGDGFWCLGHGVVWWRQGKHWWDTGIAL